VKHSIVLEDTIEIKKGAYESALLVVPDDTSKMMLRMERMGWPVSDVKNILHCKVWISYTGGRKFHFLIGFTANGNDEPECAVWRGIKPKYKTNGRMIKVTMECDCDIKTRLVTEFW